MLPCLVGLAAVPSAVAQPPPHILKVIVDDFGWGNTNYHRKQIGESHAEIVTPHMDALVEEGVLLMRHYVHPECTPSRVASMTGRLPMHSGQGGLCSPTAAGCGIPYRMGTVAEKLVNEGGYTAHHVGKWDMGAATPTHIPHGRGYNTSLAYFGHGNYQWGQIEWGQGGGGNSNLTVPPSPYDPQFIKDLWDTDRPANALSNRSRDEGVYEEALFGERLRAIVMGHDAAKPLFLSYHARVAHYPIQAPIAYQQRPRIAAIDVPHRMVYHAQVEYLDEQLGNLTALFKERGLWENTLMVLTSDNGGYTKALGPCSASDPVMGVTCMTGEAGATNHPLRGGKYSRFEGGIRSNSFVSGGLIPAAVRNTTQHGVMHIADWWSTFCALAGVDPADGAAAQHGLPPIDSLDMWPLLSGANGTSPRDELFIDTSTLIQGDWKLITGAASSASWPGPTYPNASTAAHKNSLDKYTAKCSPKEPCLYNVGGGTDGDWTEHHNVAAANPAVASAMAARLAVLAKTVFTNPNATAEYGAHCQDAKAVYRSYGGFYGPWCLVPPVPTPAPPQPPGPFVPTKLANCTWVSGKGIRPSHRIAAGAASDKEACCGLCGLNANCVAATHQCYPDRACECHLHAFQPDATLAAQDNSTVCVTGRAPAPKAAAAAARPTSEEELLNWGVH